MRYCTVSLDRQPTGLNLFVSMSTVEFWVEEKASYPNNYTYMGDRCTWLIHSNTELTPKLITSLGEECDRICADNARINDKRKLANR